VHDKRCGVLNVDGFFDGLLAFFAHAVENGFIRRRQFEALVVADDVDTLLDALVGPVRSPAGTRSSSAARRRTVEAS
jgi:predicted Rossmann-fold nucleotide-binding protein